jgi:hypothetical protein
MTTESVFCPIIRDNCRNDCRFAIRDNYEYNLELEENKKNITFGLKPVLQDAINEAAAGSVPVAGIDTVDTPPILPPLPEGDPNPVTVTYSGDIDYFPCQLIELNKNVKRLADVEELKRIEGV